MRSLLSDLRYGVRLLRASPGFTAVAVLTLALGIAVNTTVLSWVDAVRLHPYPGVGDPQGLALIETITPSGEILVNTSYLDYRDYRDTLTLVSGLAVARFTPLSVGEGGRTERAWAELVSANYFDVLKVKAVLGRAFLPEEGGDQPGAHPVAVISHRMTMVPVWEGHLGAQGLLRRPLQILMAVCLLLLLIVCANVANLLLARAVSRQKEFSIRLAVGAGRGRLARQLITETLLLAGAGGLAGVILVEWMGRSLMTLLPPSDLPIDLGGGLRVSTLGFLLLIVVAATLVSGLPRGLDAVASTGGRGLRAGAQRADDDPPGDRSARVLPTDGHSAAGRPRLHRARRRGRAGANPRQRNVRAAVLLAGEPDRPQGADRG